GKGQNFNSVVDPFDALDSLQRFARIIFRNRLRHLPLKNHRTSLDAKRNIVENIDTRKIQKLMPNLFDDVCPFAGESRVPLTRTSRHQSTNHKNVTEEHVSVLLSNLMIDKIISGIPSYEITPHRDSSSAEKGACPLGNRQRAMAPRMPPGGIDRTRVRSVWV